MFTNTHKLIFTHILTQHLKPFLFSLCHFFLHHYLPIIFWIFDDHEGHPVLGFITSLKVQTEGIVKNGSQSILPPAPSVTSTCATTEHNSRWSSRTAGSWNHSQPLHQISTSNLLSTSFYIYQIQLGASFH